MRLGGAGDLPRGVAEIMTFLGTSASCRFGAGFWIDKISFFGQKCSLVLGHWTASSKQNRLNRWIPTWRSSHTYSWGIWDTLRPIVVTEVLGIWRHDFLSVSFWNLQGFKSLLLPQFPVRPTAVVKNFDSIWLTSLRHHGRRISVKICVA